MKKTRVLVIDDNKNLVKMVKEYFQENPEIKVVLDASDGVEAIRLIDKKKDDFDLIVLDLIMPTKDGMSILEHMKEKNIKTPKKNSTTAAISFVRFVFLTFMPD